MARKSIKTQVPKKGKKMVVSKKQTKKKKAELKKKKKQQISQSQQNEDEQQVDGDDVNSSGDNHKEQKNNENSSEQSQNQGSDEQQSGQEQSQQSSSLAPENLAIKQMQFRQRRGTKMNYLMNRKKDQEEDQFWKNQGQDYFGSLQDQQDDEDYQQSSSGRDQFDSDFDQTESEHDEQEEKAEEPALEDQQGLKEKKKQQELMRKIGASAPKKPTPTTTVKTNVSVKKVETEKKAPAPEPINRYIHQVCTQQQLLAEAAQTQYINWLSLQKLISIQNQKKDFTIKEHFIEGDKIIFRDKIDSQGKRSSSYELVGVTIQKISDLSQAQNKSDV